MGIEEKIVRALENFIGYIQAIKKEIQTSTRIGRFLKKNWDFVCVFGIFIYCFFFPSDKPWPESRYQLYVHDPWYPILRWLIPLFFLCSALYYRWRCEDDDNDK